jgi:hypothetical protein
MEQEIIDLARSAGATVVTLMATDGWQRARDGIARLWNRVQPERTDSIVGEIETTRDDLLLARQAGDNETERELSDEWAGRLRRMLVADPHAVAALRDLLSDLEEALPKGGNVAGNDINMRAHAHGSARVYQAGRDQHITER